MPIFGKKKVEEDIKKVKEAIEKPVEEKVEKERPEEKTVSAAPSVFIKIERYEKILDEINDLKSKMVSIKNVFSVLNDLEKLREESLKLIGDAMEKVDKRLLALDSEFTRPYGYEEEYPKEAYPAEGLEEVIGDLKSQLDQLKTELQSLT